MLTSRWTNVRHSDRPSLRADNTFSYSIDTFEINRERAIDYLNTRDNVYVFDGFAGVRFVDHQSSTLS